MSWLSGLVDKIFNGKDKDQCQNQNATVKFSDMDKKHQKKQPIAKFDPQLPHRVVKRGLNLEGICRNQDCSAFQKKVWVQLGYGKFNINKEVHNCNCPICQKQLPYQTVLSLGYTRASMVAEGKRLNEGKTKWSLTPQKEGKLIKFEGENESISDWEYLEVIVSRLKWQISIF